MLIKFLTTIMLACSPTFGSSNSHTQLINEIKSGKYVQHIPNYQTLHTWHDAIDDLTPEDQLNIQAYHFANSEDYEKTLWSEESVNRFTSLVALSRDHPASGWKIHISAAHDNASKIAQVVVPFLLHHQTPLKIAGSLDFLETLKKDPTQEGKFITIYPKTYKQAKRIAHQLNELIREHGLNSLEVPRLLYDAQIGDTGLVFVRYGKHIERKRSDKSVTFIGPFGKRHKDKKILDSRYFPFPEFVWKFNKKALSGDARPFQDMTFKWIFPGTTHSLFLNNGSVKSWQTVIDAEYEVLEADIHKGTCEALHEHLRRMG